MGEFVKHTACPSCGSSDGLAIYSDDSSHCFVCQKTVPSEEFKEANKEPKKVRKSVRKEVMTEKVKTAVTSQQTEELKSRTSLSARGYRGIKDETLKTFGVRTEFNEETGEVYCTYYPCTVNGELSGWKPRVHPKQFGGSIGQTGSNCDLFGQFKFKNGGKTVLIVGGEHDQLAAYQMLKEYYVSKGWDFEPVVVSPTVGETGCAKQIAAQYIWFNQSDKIVVAMDSDEAGQKAIDKIVAALPKGKVFVAKWSGKDPNEMLLKGKERQFISDFYNAKAYVPAGVVGSNELYDKIVAQAEQIKVPFPPFLKTLNDMLGGGLNLGHIYTCSGVTGGGKTSLINEMIYHWLFHSPYQIGVVSMELNAGQYGEVLLSRHIQQKLAKLNHDDKIKLLSTDQIRLMGKELFEKEDGSPRFMLIDDRDSSLEQFQDTIEQMIISSGVKIVVIDPWSDVLDGLSNEEQALAMKWLKSCIKSHGCSFFLINHVRKSQNGGKNDQSAGGKITESDIMGSSTIMKSASANILLMRNKDAEDIQERNTTNISLAKNRLLGLTGPAGKVYYDFETHTLHDLEEWSKQNGPKDF